MKIKKIQFVIFFVHMVSILVLEWEHKFVLAPKCTKELFSHFHNNFLLINCLNSRPEIASKVRELTVTLTPALTLTPNLTLPPTPKTSKITLL